MCIRQLNHFVIQLSEQSPIVPNDGASRTATRLLLTFTPTPRVSPASPWREPQTYRHAVSTSRIRPVNYFDKSVDHQMNPFRMGPFYPNSP